MTWQYDGDSASNVNNPVSDLQTWRSVHHKCGARAQVLDVISFLIPLSVV